MEELLCEIRVSTCLERVESCNDLNSRIRMFVVMANNFDGLWRIAEIQS